MQDKYSTMAPAKLDGMAAVLSEVLTLNMAIAANASKETDVLGYQNVINTTNITAYAYVPPTVATTTCRLWDGLLASSHC